MAGQIIKRSDKTYIIRIYNGRDGEGRRKYVNRTVHGTKKDADRVRNEMLTQRDLGGLAKPVRQTLDAHLTAWIENVATPRVRQRTLDGYTSICDRYIRPALGPKLISQIYPNDIQGHYQKLIASGLSARTVRHVHAVLNNALKFAVRWKLIGFNPCEHVDLPKTKRTTMRALSPEEAKRFLTAARSDDWYAFFLLQLTSGMRPGETLALRWSDIDVASGIIRVERALSGRPGKQKFEEPKTSQSRRQIPVPKSTIDALLELRSRIEEPSAETDAFGLVFRTAKGAPLDLPNLNKRHFKAILKAASLPQSIRIYDLRHSCATLLLAGGENPKIVAERLGHASIVLTLDTYSHVLPDMQRGASDRLERMLG